MHTRCNSIDLFDKCVYNKICLLVPAAAGKHRAGSAVGAEIVDAVDGEQIGEPGARAIDAALDRADGAAAGTGLGWRL